MGKALIRPRRLRRGDTVAAVSLSSGMMGDPQFIHRYEIARERLEGDFGLRLVPMPHALSGSRFIEENPALRAQDLMDAFRDPSIAAVFSAIGGDDTIRLLPYIDFDVLRRNPKIFMGYSDTTVNHLMLWKAGVASFYGPSLLAEFGEYGEMFPYTKRAVADLLFSAPAQYPLLPAPEWTDDWIPWEEKNRDIRYRMKPDTHGYEVISGAGKVRGRLLGGCIDVFPMAVGTAVWPPLCDWEGAVLFIETSEDKPGPEWICYILRGLAAQGILGAVSGILVGKPLGEVYYEEYKKEIIRIVVDEEHRPELPVFYNVNFGHAKPIGVLPYGVLTELDCEERSITFLECPTAG